jgi:hypothetical protein
VSNGSYYYYIYGAQPSMAGTYYAVVTNSAGSVTSREAVVTVDSNISRPVITYVSGSAAANGGENASLEIGTSSTVQAVQWLKNGAVIGGATSTSYSLGNFSLSSIGTYTAQVTTAAGTFTSREIALELLNSGLAPVITTQPAGANVAVGQSIGFSVRAEGEMPFTYQWRKDGTNIPGANSSSYYLGSATTAQAGNYTVVVTNRNGSVTSTTAALSVTNTAVAAPVITVHPTSQVVTGSYSYLSLSVSVLDGTGVSYQWRKDGTNLPGATSYSYSVGYVTSTAAGRYSVVVSNSLGSVTSYDANVSVTSRVTGPTFTTQPQSQGAFTGTRVTFSAAASGSGTISYQWRKNGLDIFGATATSYAIASVQQSDAGSYSVLATDSNGSTSSSSAVLTVQTAGVAPVILASPVSQTVVAGTSVSFAGSASGTPPPAYQWRKNGIAIPGATSSTLAFSSAQSTDGGTYSFTATNGFGSVTSGVATLTVTIPLPVITVQPAGGTFPAGTSVQVAARATGPSLAYQWRKNGANIAGATDSFLNLNNTQPGDSGRYSVVISNSYGSVTSADGVLAIVSASPAASRTVSAGDSVSLTVSVQSTVPLTYRWARNGGEILGATNATLTLNNVRTTDAGIYTVGISTAGGTQIYPLTGVGALATTLSVVPRPGPSIVRQPVGGSVAVGGSFTFSVVASGDNFTYQWQKDGVPIPDRIGPNLVLDNVQRSDAGDYRVVLLSASGPVYSSPAHLEVIGSAFAGTYFGAFANGDVWAMHVNADSTGVFLALLGTRAQAIVSRNVVVGGTGAFSTGASATIAIEGGALSARYYTGEVSGTIAGGSVTGAIKTLGTSLSGKAGAVSGTAAAGFYEAVPLAADAGEIDAIVAADGRMLLVAVDATAVRGGMGSADVSGVFSIMQPGVFEYRGSLNQASAGLQGVYTPAVGPPVLFATPAPAQLEDRLANVATRGLTGPGLRVLTAGFVITGTASKEVLIRAVGPGLASFGVPGLLANPKLRLFRGNDPWLENDDWGLGGFATQISEAAGRVGAFPLPTGSADAAIVARLDPGQYSAQITADGDVSGVALIEVYDAAPATASGSKLINVSTRGEVGRGGDVLIVGVVVGGTAPKKLLIRGVGPALAAFGLPGALADPKLELYQGRTLLRQNDNWSDSADSSAIAAAAAAVGGFVLPSGSKDAALLLYLAPGSYTAQVSGVNATTGIALVEAYEVP